MMDFIVSLVVAAKNNETPGGSKGIGFAAVWSCFLVIVFSSAGCQVVFKGNNSAVMIGFLFGCSIMLAELFFVLMCVFFTYGTNAKTNKLGNDILYVISIFQLCII